MSFRPMRQRDDRAREVCFAKEPKRVVSLIPSDTYTLFAMGLGERLVGRTDYCVLPESAAPIPSIGGTKDANVSKILDLAPDLVIANQEENERGTIETLVAHQIPVFIVFPKRVEDGFALIARYAKLFAVHQAHTVKALLASAYETMKWMVHTQKNDERTVRVFCPIWRHPLMTIHQSTYISQSLQIAGAINVFAERQRRYPLSADLGQHVPLAVYEREGRDVRYPRIGEAELIERNPDLVLLPDEPYAFSREDASYFASLPISAAKTRQIELISGKDLCWYGAYAINGIRRLRTVVEKHLETHSTR